MNLKQMYAHLEGAGYDGPMEREAMRTWATENDEAIEFVDAEGKARSFDDVCPKGITVAFSRNDAEADTVEVVDADAPATEDATKADEEEAEDREDEMDQESADMKAFRRWQAERSEKGRKARAAGAPAVRTSPDTKNYRERIARGKRGGLNHISQRAVFDDVEKAETAGATMRLHLFKHAGYPQRARDVEIVGKAAEEGILARGGATVPDDFEAELITLLNEYGAARQLCDARQTARDFVELPRLDADLTVSWTAEGGQSSDQNPDMSLVGVTIRKLQGIIKVSNELIEDSALNIVDDLFNSLARNIANKEDEAFFNGDGTSTYGNITGFITALGAGGTKTQTTGTTWAAIVDADVQAMLGLLPSYAYGRGNPKMTCTPGAFYNIINRISRGIGGVTYTESSAGVVQPVYNGYPVVFNDVMAAATAVTTVSVLFGDFDMGAKMRVKAGGTELATSEHFAFDADQLTLRARHRVGITVHDAGDASNAGPVVGLKTGT